MKFFAVAMATALLVSACGTGESGTAATVSSTTVTTQPSSTTTSNPPTTSDVSTTTSISSTTTVAETYDVILEGGTEEIPEITVSGLDVFEVTLSETASISVLSSVDGDLHLHGYDLHFPLVAGEVTTVVFDATIPGIFEAELEEESLLLFEVEVSP